MATTLYCRWEHCGWSGTIQAGNFPAHCPKCRRESRWNVGVPSVFVSQVSEMDGNTPAHDWVLNENDRRFLRSIRVAATNDHEDDGA